MFERITSRCGMVSRPCHPSDRKVSSCPSPTAGSVGCYVPGSRLPQREFTYRIRPIATNTHHERTKKHEGLWPFRAFVVSSFPLPLCHNLPTMTQQECRLHSPFEGGKGDVSSRSTATTPLSRSTQHTSPFIPPSKGERETSALSARDTMYPPEKRRHGHRTP